jgi:hypothetical protein
MKRTENFPLSLSTFLFGITTISAAESRGGTVISERELTGDEAGWTGIL